MPKYLVMLLLLIAAALGLLLYLTKSTEQNLKPAIEKAVNHTPNNAAIIKKSIANEELKTELKEKVIDTNKKEMTQEPTVALAEEKSGKMLTVKVTDKNGISIKNAWVRVTCDKSETSPPQAVGLPLYGWCNLFSEPFDGAL